MINQVKRELKELGYKISLKTMSWGVHATFVHSASKDRLDYNVFTGEQLSRWKPLFMYQQSNAEKLSLVRQESGIYGLMK